MNSTPQNNRSTNIFHGVVTFARVKFGALIKDRRQKAAIIFLARQHSQRQAQRVNVGALVGLLKAVLFGRGKSRRAD